MEPIMAVIAVIIIFAIAGSIIEKTKAWYITASVSISIFLMMFIYLSATPVIYGEEKLYYNGKPGSMGVKKGKCGNKRFSAGNATWIWKERYMISDEQLYDFVKKDGLLLR
jgi:membrane protein YdbS with pleckstrin-like domain